MIKLLFTMSGRQLLFEYALGCAQTPRIAGRKRLQAAPQISGTQRRPKDAPRSWTPKLRGTLTVVDPESATRIRGLQTLEPRTPDAHGH